jgi:hypothetical protein
VIYDGFSQTSRFTQLADKMIAGWSWLGVHTDVLRTIVLVGVVVLFVGLYIGVCALMSERRNALATAARYAPTLVPIAPVYFIAHYFTYAWTQVVLIVRVALGRRLAPQRTLAFQAPLEVKVA